MKIIILASTTNLKHAAGMDRVIYNAKEACNKEFELVVYLSANNFHNFCKGVVKILINNPFSFSFIIFNALSSVRSKSISFWKMYYCLSWIFRIKRVFYWHEMPEYYANFSKKFSSNSKSIEYFFKNKKTIQLSCSELSKETALFFDDKPNVTNINNCIIPRTLNKNILLSKFTVITIASIQEIKGTDIWTDVAIKVCQQNKDIQFIWCGGIVNNQMFVECLRKIKEAKLEEQIIFMGKVEDAAVLASTAHLYYCSSRLDSFPLAVLEAMNHGKNIIYYNSGGVMEAVGENGFFIPNFLIENTVDAILKKHQEFLTNPNTVFNKEVYDKFYNNYTPEIFAKKLKVALERNN
jgi:glycosyltransferase involved in cell wall biosynthesis